MAERASMVFMAPGDVRKARVEPISWMRTAEAFAARGVRVTLVTLRTRRPDGVAMRDVRAHFGVTGRFRIVESPTPLTTSSSTLRFRTSALATATVVAALVLLRAAVSRRPQIVYARVPVLVVPFVLSKRLLPPSRRPRLVYETHTMPTGSNLRFIRQADLVVVNSDRLAGDLGAKVGDAVRVAHVPLPPYNDAVPVPRDEARRRLGLPQDAPTGCYSGKMVEDQLDFLMRTAALVARRVDGFRLLLVGGNPAILEWARARAVELDAAGAVVFAGFVAPTEVATYQSAADVLVFHMSEELEHFAYCTPAKGFEYQAMARPIAATDIPLFEEVFGRDGERTVRVRERTPEALARGIQTALELGPDGAAMAARAREWVASRTWQRRADDVLDLLDL